MLIEGQKAPSFTLHDHTGLDRSLNDYKGQWLLVYFYPKDDTPGCTKEACAFRDLFPQLRQHVTILGISADPVSAHQQFSQKYQLPFTLLSDPNKKTIQEYHAWGKKKFMGREFEGILRVSYLINPEGTIVKTYPQVKPADHAQEILQDLKQLQS